MSTTWPIVVLDLFSRAECERIVGLTRAFAWLPARCGGYCDGHVKAESTALPRGEAGEWLRGRMAWAMAEANLRFNLATFPDVDGIDDYTIFRYDVGGHFDWHMDNADLGETQRKVSITVQLSAPADYEGGNLEFLPGGVAGLSRQQGAAIVFPAFLCHRITPVRRGVRLSVAGSLVGPPLN